MKREFTKERYRFIKKKTHELLALTKNNNPFYISEVLGVEYKIRPLKGKLPGFMLDDVIFINRKIDYYSRRIVCTHELGHYILHRNSNAFELFYSGDESITEFEANLFVKEIMPYAFSSVELSDFEYISDFNKYIEGQIRFLE